MSDHSLIYAVRKARKRLRGPSRIIRTRSYRSMDETKFVDDLKLTSWNSIDSAE